MEEKKISCVTPTKNDILCGRGNTCYEHIGNQRFRVIIAVHLPKYTDPKTTRQQKTLLIQKMVEEMYLDGSRFLRENAGGWCVLSRVEAQAKVGHALRDSAAEMRRCLNPKDQKGGVLPGCLSVSGSLKFIDVEPIRAGTISTSSTNILQLDQSENI